MLVAAQKNKKLTLMRSIITEIFRFSDDCPPLASTNRVSKDIINIILPLCVPTHQLYILLVTKYMLQTGKDWKIPYNLCGSTTFLLLFPPNTSLSASFLAGSLYRVHRISNIP